jgi:hypothetical protein
MGTIDYSFGTSIASVTETINKILTKLIKYARGIKHGGGKVPPEMSRDDRTAGQHFCDEAKHFPSGSGGGNYGKKVSCGETAADGGNTKTEHAVRSAFGGIDTNRTSDYGQSWTWRRRYFLRDVCDAINNCRSEEELVLLEHLLRETLDRDFCGRTWMGIYKYLDIRFSELVERDFGFAK